MITMNPASPQYPTTLVFIFMTYSPFSGERRVENSFFSFLLVRVGGAHPDVAALARDSNGGDIESSRVPEQAGDLHLLHQILLSRQLLEDAVTRPYREPWRQRGRPHLGAINRSHL